MKRLGADRRRLVVEKRIGPDVEADAVERKTFGGAEQRRRIGHAAENEVRVMWGIARMKEADANGLENGVSGLNADVRLLNVGADENV